MSGVGTVAGWLLTAAGLSAVALGSSVRPRWTPAWRARQGQTSLVRVWVRVVGRHLRQNSHDREWEAGFESAVGRLAGLLASGHTVIGALERVSGGTGPFHAQLGKVVAMISAGASLTDALARWPGRVERDLLDRLRGLIGAQQRTGASLARPLWTLVGQCQRRRELRERARGQTAEVRWTARLLLGLPPALATYVLLARRELLIVLLGSLPGRITVAYAVVSWVLGGLLIRRMLERATHSPWAPGWGEGR